MFLNAKQKVRTPKVLTGRETWVTLFYSLIKQDELRLKYAGEASGLHQYRNGLGTDDHLFIDRPQV